MLAGTVLADALRLQHLVSDLLLLAAADERAPPGEAGPVDLDDVVFEQAARLRGLPGLTVDGWTGPARPVSVARASVSRSWPRSPPPAAPRSWWPTRRSAAPASRSMARRTWLIGGVAAAAVIAAGAGVASATGTMPGADTDTSISGEALTRAPATPR